MVTMGTGHALMGTLTPALLLSSPLPSCHEVSSFAPPYTTHDALPHHRPKGHGAKSLKL